MKTYTLIAAFAAVLTIGACSSDDVNGPIIDGPAAVLTVVFPSRPADTLAVLVTDTATITAAERFVQTDSGPHLVMGRIVKGAGWDIRYPFHFLPDSVKLTEVAIELCDGAPMHTEAEVDAFIRGSTGDSTATSAVWCPWESKPVAVERIGSQ